LRLVDQTLRFRSINALAADAMNTRNGLRGVSGVPVVEGTVVVLANDKVVTGTGQAGHVGQAEVTSGAGVLVDVTSGSPRRSNP